MIDFPNHNRNIYQLNQTNPTITDCWRMNAVISEIKTNQSRLKSLLQQFVLFHEEKILQKHSLPYILRSHLLQQINIEASNLIVAWELLKETTHHLFAENDIENDFAKDIKNIREDMNGILQKIDMVTT